MEARRADELPASEGPWQYEPKWDGFRCLAFKCQDAVELRAKSGKPLSRYFPEVVDALARLPVTQFVLDGELQVIIRRRAEFDALQMRLHPAETRIRRLSLETPARLTVFDILLDHDGAVQLDKPLRERRRALVEFLRAVGPSAMLKLSPATSRLATAQRWLSEAGPDGKDGVVAKRLDEPYAPGERAMIKVKRIRTADCVVGGYRYLAGRKEVGSLLLGLYDQGGLLHHVGFTSTISNEDRLALTRRLEGLRSPPGFTGDAPGGPSRWSTERSAAWEPLRPELVVEVSFDQVTGGRFRHGTRLLRWRPDKSPRQCTCEQLA